MSNYNNSQLQAELGAQIKDPIISQLFYILSLVIIATISGIMKYLHDYIIAKNQISHTTCSFERMNTNIKQLETHIIRQQSSPLNDNENIDKQK